MSQMPTLEADDFVICQSSAIGRFVARELSLYGANSQEQTIIDQVCETLNDVGSELIKIYYGGFDEETKVGHLELNLFLGLISFSFVFLLDFR